jgi:hypothetical protein
MKEEDSSDIVQMLITAPNVDVNVVNKHGQSPLHLAVMRDSSKIVQVLLNKEGINVNVEDGRRHKPLDYLQPNSNEIEEMLKGNGGEKVNLWIKNRLLNSVNSVDIEAILDFQEEKIHGKDIAALGILIKMEDQVDLVILQHETEMSTTIWVKNLPAEN